VLFLSGALSGVLAANGLSNQKRTQTIEDDHATH